MDYEGLVFITLRNLLSIVFRVTVALTKSVVFVPIFSFFRTVSGIASEKLPLKNLRIPTISSISFSLKSLQCEAPFPFSLTFGGRNRLLSRREIPGVLVPAFGVNGMLCSHNVQSPLISRREGAVAAVLQPAQHGPGLA